jgi:predicted PolB exonuclease-like 3'-5' exonuclease
VSDFGASARGKLNEICSVMGFAGKFDVDGSQISTMYYNNQINEIRNYCETDVLNAYLV